MKHTATWILLVVLLTAAGNAARAAAQADIEKANDSGKNVLLVVTVPGATGTEEALKLAREAADSAGTCVVVQMDRSDPANTGLVAEYRLAGAPLPLVLAVARNGKVAGGIPAAQATVDRLLGMLPTPSEAEVILALSEGKAVFVVAGSDTMTDYPAVLDSCEAAAASMESGAALVSVDLASEPEAPLLRKLGINLASALPVTTVITAQGAVLRTFIGPVSSAVLAATASQGSGGG